MELDWTDEKVQKLMLRITKMEKKLAKQWKRMDVENALLMERINVLAKENEKLREQIEKAQNLGFIP